MNPFSFIGFIFHTWFFVPVVNALVLIVHGLNFTQLPGTLGLAIIALTVLIRFLIYPLTHAQLKSSKKMQELTPLLSKLKEKHKGDSKQLQLETMKLYKEHGANPAAGCLPTLMQIPLIWALYQSIFVLFNSTSSLEEINKILYSFAPPLTQMPDSHFLGFNLIHKPSEFMRFGWILLLIPVVTALLQFVQTKMMSPHPVKKYPTDSPKEKKEKTQTEEAMSMAQSQMMYMTPLLIGYFSWQFPVGLALYWNTFTIFGILQQYRVQGLGGLLHWKQLAEQWLKKKKQ